MKITTGKCQINFIFDDETTSIHLWVRRIGIYQLGISYDPWKPFRNISIDFVLFGIDLFF